MLVFKCYILGSNNIYYCRTHYNVFIQNINFCSFINFYNSVILISKIV